MKTIDWPNFSSYKLAGNRALGGGYYLMEVENPLPVKSGQFYMMRAWDTEPLLSRPLSVFDAGGGRTAFVYRVIGRGTAIFAALKPGDSVKLLGALGNGFPALDGTAAIVGGGAGCAPLYLAAKQIMSIGAGKVDAYLGFSGEPFLLKEFEGVANRLTVNTYGLIPDDVEPAAYDYIFSCGPPAMMNALYEKCKAAGKGGSLYVSMEARMACGIGTCLVCSCAAAGGRKKVCRDGPVFPAQEVFGL
ncbi:MAG: dihydroorotate dehydrogenase electron transfer subunit [Spirochaetes bacterium]|nr:dihydroorotate dehydrogenase electron transfer subunit [Spirochaetota bacterium]